MVPILTLEEGTYRLSPGTSVRNYQYTLRNGRGERSSLLCYFVCLYVCFFVVVNDVISSDDKRSVISNTLPHTVAEIELSVAWVDRFSTNLGAVLKLWAPVV